MASKKLITKSIDPQSAIRMFIIDSNISDQTTPKMKRQENLLLQYNSLTREQKYYLAKFTSDIIISKYLNNEKFNEYMFSYCLFSSTEEDWHYSKKLIENLFNKIYDENFIRKICENLFEIVDQEFSIENNERNIAANCLALIVDIGISIFEKNSKNESSKNSHDTIVEYITSNLLARGNINNIEIRIAIVYYLSRVEEKLKINLQKILSRFGQSLLEHIFTKYFSNDEKSSQVAFIFLAEHLSNFLSGSAFLAEMGNSVLQNQMLKNPNEFINFIDDYSNSAKTNLEDSISINIHLSFLLKKACEVNKPELIQGLLSIILKVLTNIKNISEDKFIDNFENVVEIISRAHSKQIRDSIQTITKFYLENSKKDKSNIIHKNFNKNKTYKKPNLIDKNKREALFQEIFILAK